MLPSDSQCLAGNASTNQGVVWFFFEASLLNEGVVGLLPGDSPSAAGDAHAKRRSRPRGELDVQRT